MRHRIGPEALQDLRRVLELCPPPPQNPADLSEGATQGAIRLEARRRGATLWRNNVGVLPDRMGRPVRFGLANDSAKLNERVKSSDLIGITPVKIGAAQLGRVLGVFTAVECKRGVWGWTGTGREKAQRRFIDLVRLYGGLAQFARSPEELEI